MIEVPKSIYIRLKMKATANKRGVLVDHPQQRIRCSSVHFTTLSGGLAVAAEDIEAIELLPSDEDESTTT